MAAHRALKWSLSVAVLVLACLIIWLGVRYSTPVQVKQYDFTGTVVAVQAESGVVRVHNGNMPGFMAPMDMDYQLKDKRVLSSLQPGDIIHAALFHDGQGLWELRNVTVHKTR